jgi:AraC family transcriptional regulator, ethanolamine operon transcriptional activator
MNLPQTSALRPSDAHDAPSWYPRVPAEAAPSDALARPARSLRRHTSSAADADEHARHLTAWDQCYDQLSAGRFEGQLTELRLPHMQVFREHTSQALRQSCRVWEDSFWFGLPQAATEAPARINGRTNTGQDLLVRPGGSPFELVTPPDHAVDGVVVRRQWLLDAARQQGCELDVARLSHAEMLTLSPTARRGWLQALHGLLHTPETDWNPALTTEKLQDALLCPLLGALDTREVDAGVRRSLARRQKVVAEAREHLLRHPDLPITVPELCGHLHVSRRTLQYCFEDVLGLSPVQALRTLRLNGVRRALRHAAHQGLGVQDVAAQWGFWHLSQFGSDYRRLFGETPSHTLRHGTH